MLLDVKGRMRKADATPTIQCRVDAQIFESFSAFSAGEEWARIGISLDNFAE